MNLRSILAIAIMSTISIGAQANILSEQFIKRELVESATSATPTNANEHLYARMVSSKGAAKSIFSVWSNYEDQAVIGARWGEVGLNLLRWSNPDRQYDWKSSRRIEGVPQLVYQQDSLINLERVEYRYDGYPTKVISGYQVADTSRPARAIPKTSERLLAEGLAPIGPDNRAINACRIGISSQAPYVEVSEAQKAEYTKVTGLPFVTCLTGSTANAYWKARYSDFIDKYHDRKPVNVKSDVK